MLFSIYGLPFGPVGFGPVGFGPGVFGPGVFGPGVFGPGVFGPGVFGPVGLLDGVFFVLGPLFLALATNL